MLLPDWETKKSVDWVYHYDPKLDNLDQARLDRAYINNDKLSKLISSKGIDAWFDCREIFTYNEKYFPFTSILKQYDVPVYSGDLRSTIPNHKGIISFLSNNYVGFPSRHPRMSYAVGHIARKERSHRVKLHNSIKDINNTFSKLGLFDWDSNTHLNTLPNSIMDSFVYLVSETYFYDCPVYGNPIFITEKTLKAFSHRKPFIIASNYGFLSYLKKLGFKTFDKWWDESYDSIKDDDERLAAIVSLVNTLSELTPSKMHAMRFEMLEVLDHNYDLFKKMLASSTNFPIFKEQLDKLYYKQKDIEWVIPFVLADEYYVKD